MPFLCGGAYRPWDLNTTQGNSTLATALDDALFAAFNGSLASNEAAVYCASNADICLGICPNADVTGVGVRVAFYLNAILTAMLVGLSPNESPSAAWSSALLTMSLVIPAVIQKSQQALSLYHATLVLNFATFSSVSSLAMAPLCTVWRQIDNKSHTQYKTPNAPTVSLPDGNVQDAAAQLVKTTTVPQRRRSRVILSFAVIAQVSLQWAWATYLFTSPYYAQQACSPSTTVVLFGISMTAYNVNHGHFGLWASWLLFSIGVTLVFGVLFVISSTSGANSSGVPRPLLRRPKAESRLSAQIHRWDRNGDKRRFIIFAAAFVICVMLVVFSEMQVNENCVFGEDSQWGFGQIAALLFALAPVWGIFESERGRILATKLVNLKGLSVKNKVPHSEVPEEIPLLFSREHSPESSNGSVSGSPRRGDSALHPAHSTADPSHLTAEIPTLDSLSLADPRPRRASLESMSSTMMGFHVIPPSPEESRAPSSNQSPVDLFHFVEGSSNHGRRSGS